MSAQVHVPIDRGRDVRVAGDLANLYALRAVVERNTPADCDKTHDENLRNVLTIAARELRDSHVFKARFPDGTEVFFTAGRVPAYVTPLAVLRAAGYGGEVAA